MRTLFTALAIGGSALLLASPASAQFYPPAGSYDYGHGSGYNPGWGQVQLIQSRISNIFRSLGGVRPDQRYQIRAEAVALNRQLRVAAANGLDPYELGDLDRRLNRLERQEQRASLSGWNRYNPYNSYDGYNGYPSNEGYGRHRDDDDDRDDDNDGPGLR